MPYKDPEKKRERDRAYREANLDKERERMRVYRETNLDRVLERHRAYYEANRDRVLERQRAYREENPDRVLERHRAYREANLDYLRWQASAKRQRRREIPDPRRGEKWTPTEDAIALREDLTTVEVCYMLGRSHHSVASRRLRLRKQVAA